MRSVETMVKAIYSKKKKKKERGKKMVRASTNNQKWQSVL